MQIKNKTMAVSSAMRNGSSKERTPTHLPLLWLRFTLSQVSTNLNDSWSYWCSENQCLKFRNLTVAYISKENQSLLFVSQYLKRKRPMRAYQCEQAWQKTLAPSSLNSFGWQSVKGLLQTSLPIWLLKDDFRLTRLSKQLKAAIPFLTIVKLEAPKHSNKEQI